jgi:hypothetical protein
MKNYSREKKMKSDSFLGRSMIEMLGVLAIIGTLSVGGLLGYKKLIGKLDSNDILDIIQKTSLEASEKRSKGLPIQPIQTITDKNYVFKSKYPITWTEQYNGKDTFFSISASNIPQNVCNEMLKMEMTFANKMLLNDIPDNKNCLDKENSFKFVFTNDLNDQVSVGIQDPNRDSQGDCKAGYNGESCEEKDQTCSGNGTYDSLDDFAFCSCKAGYGGNNCEETCPNDKYPLLGFNMSTKKYDGSCHACESGAWMIPDSECSKCPNRKGLRFIGLGLCLPCSFPDGIQTTKAECDNCAPLRTYNSKGVCVLDACNGFRTDIGTCLPCNVEGDWKTKEAAACTACTQREYFNGTCYETKCENGRNNDGSCKQ